ncbi:30S ribosomal protein S20 [Halothermothrix orenii]|uniref:Small ribosomal subunit protein bS20 n=1 Tax=Halothermothrix orenii (strain H 168 / OCM 544 / DSM 9562) TaxID=373903 RepID=RS20_HALOH|nr:30S ribosomal protein S20 [Halothermothrix orenii]B8CXL9.1 RecName: Full=Small ribosomal subunit protein bS20; AltName: Full=30S ribosomal protein S20 [Halothermothrix orenii H 168]ACL70038.1 ribosomal protein S20 [Halothermothrix orenii H 168]
MPIIKSAKKRVRITEKRTAYNREWKEKIKQAIKEFEKVVEEGNVEEAEAKLREASKILDKSAGKGIIHKNKAARKKSQLTRQFNKIA